MQPRAEGVPPLPIEPPRRALVVCTANVCRSPFIERLLQRLLDDRIDVDGRHWTVRSAGIRAGGAIPDDHTIVAAARYGIDLAGHRPRPLTAELLAEDGADLVIAASREHVRAVVGIDSSAWERTFTLRELARRSAALAPWFDRPSFAVWVQSLAHGRRAADTMASDTADDLADPYGLPLAEHETMIAAVDELVRHLIRTGPWIHEPTRAPEAISGQPLA